MAKARAGWAAGFLRGVRGGGPWGDPTWEISDSDTEGPAGAEAAARARDPAEERRAAAEALRPEPALRRLAVRVDPAILQDAGADILLEALGSLVFEHRVEPQLRARSLSWSRALVLLQFSLGLDMLLETSWQELSKHLCASPNDLPF
ncbi:probable crossover junction endonuclease EME2 [Elephas maximus indicus]|uniref:probable crossover junction endonuclease EME2 n=1 Tax=Elephas maximus indicus TaxID=99487 RepID=UPI002116AB1A|nr:probable crossover junction endonuclease EME2 [Elephas maximus indicus]